VPVHEPAGLRGDSRISLSPPQRAVDGIHPSGNVACQAEPLFRRAACCRLRRHVIAAGVGRHEAGPEGRAIVAHRKDLATGRAERDRDRRIFSNLRICGYLGKRRPERLTRLFDLHLRLAGPRTVPGYGPPCRRERRPIDRIDDRFDRARAQVDTDEARGSTTRR